VSVLLNQGSAKPGSFSTGVSFPALAGTGLSTISAGDFNGDGKQDIVAGNTSIAVYYGNGDGTLSSPQLTEASTTSGIQNFVTGDFNRDGLTDLAYLEPNSQSEVSSFQILFGDPSGQFVTGSNVALDPR